MAPVEWSGNLSFLAETMWAVKTKRLKADLVHVHESHWLAGVGEWIGERLRIPVYCKEACGEVLLWPEGGDVPWSAEWKRRRLLCRFIAMTPHVRRELEKAGIPSGRIHEIPNGVELAKDVAHPEANDSAIFAGNFTQGAIYKAFDVLFRAWGRIHREAPALKLRLFGGGDFARWRQVSEREGCGDSVEFLGSAGDLHAEFLKAGFLVLPSRVEGLSNVLLEAQAAGLPAVVSDIGGNLAVVNDGENGLVFPTGDAEALANAALRLYRSPELREQLGHAARARAETSFAIDRIAEKLEKMYRSDQFQLGIADGR